MPPVPYRDVRGDARRALAELSPRRGEVAISQDRGIGRPQGARRAEPTEGRSHHVALGASRERWSVRTGLNCASTAPKGGEQETAKLLRHPTATSDGRQVSIAKVVQNSRATGALQKGVLWSAWAV